MSSPISLSRRTFLTLAGAIPLLQRVSSAAKAVPVGLELYTVRDELAKDLMATIRAVARMGYEVVEFYSPYYSWTPQMAADIRKLLDDLAIRCFSTHNDNRVFTADGLQKAIELNQMIGSRTIVMASPGQVTGVDGWKVIADRLDAAADRLKPLGMSAGYHNHASEWRPIEGAEGRRPMDVLASSTRKDVVLQFDVGTCIEAGADPAGWIKSNPGRIKSIHCKDWASGGRGYGVLFGEGDAPWARIFEAAESTGGVEYYLVEQEVGPPGEQLQRAERCLANWKKLRG
jgi:sugar phosphate isomerase/epimerase